MLVRTDRVSRWRSPVTLQTYVNTYLREALPLCILLADHNLHGWFCESFIQIFTRRWNRNDEAVESIDYLDSVNVNPSYTVDTLIGDVQVKAEASVSRFLIDAIADGQCAVIFLDEFYVRAKASYGRHHFIHESLVFGYDRTGQVFQVIGLDRNAIFTFQEISRDEVDAGFGSVATLVSAQQESCVDRLGYWIKLIRRRHLQEGYPFSVRRFRAEVCDYLLGTGSPVKVFERFGVDITRLEGGGQVHVLNFGVNCYADLQRQLAASVEDNRRFDYRAFHLLAEHKRAMRERLRFSELVLPEQGDDLDLAVNFTPVVARFEAVRRLALSCRYADPYVRDELLTRLSVMLRDAETQEREILRAIVNELDMRSDRLSDVRGDAHVRVAARECPWCEALPVE